MAFARCLSDSMAFAVLLHSVFKWCVRENQTINPTINRIRCSVCVSLCLFQRWIRFDAVLLSSNIECQWPVQHWLLLWNLTERRNTLMCHAGDEIKSDTTRLKVSSTCQKARETLLHSRTRPIFLNWGLWTYYTIDREHNKKKFRATVILVRLCVSVCVCVYVCEWTEEINDDNKSAAKFFVEYYWSVSMKRAPFTSAPHIHDCKM